MGFNINKKIRKLKKMKRDVPRKVGNIAKNHFVMSFRKQGFTDKTFEPWRSRRTRNRSDRRNSRPRALLVDRGHLRRSIRVRRATWKRIQVGSFGIPYAQYHNRGGGNLPKRQFLGESRAMNNKIRALIRRELKKTMK